MESRGKNFVSRLSPPFFGRISFFAPAMRGLHEGSAIGTQIDGQTSLVWPKFAIADCGGA